MRYPEFAQTVKDDKIDLPYAALLFARNIAYPDLDIKHYLQRIENLAEAAAMKIGVDAELIDQATQMSDYLFTDGQGGFRGNSADYSDPRNSFLNDMLDRRLGLPISLSVLYLCVADQIRIPAYGIGMPGHFIVGVETRTGPIYLDPFNGGRRLKADDCAQLVARTIGYRGRFQASWLAAVPPRMILTRMLNNLRINYMHQGEWTSAVRVLAHLQILQPEVSEFIRDEGLIYFQTGQFIEAVRLLELYLAREPEAADVDAIKKSIGEQLTDWVKLN